MTTIAQQNQSKELAERGWRMETISSPDGTEVSVQVPLTDAEFLHPQEGYHLPNSTFHDNITGETKDMLARRYASDPETAVFGDLIIKWDVSGLGDHCPDVCVVFGVLNKEHKQSNGLHKQSNEPQDWQNSYAHRELSQIWFDKNDLSISIRNFGE